MQDLLYTHVPAAKLPHGARWYCKSCCANGATGLSNGIYNCAASSNYHEMRKIYYSNTTAIVLRVTKDRVLIKSRGTRSKNSWQSPIYPQVESPLCTRYASRERIGTVQSASIPEDLKSAHKWRSCPKLVFGNWNIFSLAGKESEIVEEAKRYSLVVLTLQSWTMGGSHRWPRIRSVGVDSDRIPRFFRT